MANDEKDKRYNSFTVDCMISLSGILSVLDSGFNRQYVQLVNYRYSIIVENTICHAKSLFRKFFESAPSEYLF